MFSKEALEALPLPAYTCDTTGRVVAYNSRAASLWGQAPQLHSHGILYCGSYSLFDLDGNPLAPEQTPVARCLSDPGSEVVERLLLGLPDGQQRQVIANVCPVRHESGRLRGVVCQLVDISNRSSTNAILQQVLATVSPAIGADFFDTLVGKLFEVCKVRYVLIGELDPHEQDMIHVLSGCQDGAEMKQFSYSLNGTPCENVVEKSLCFHADSVQSKFPKDALLAGMGVESYMGIPLISQRGRVLGVLVLMHNEPFPNPTQIENIIKLVAARASAEIERKQVEEENQAMQNQLQMSGKQESLSVMSGGIAHEFNNLLASIIGNAGLAARKLDPDSPVRKLVDKIENAAERSAELTRQIKAYSGKDSVSGDPVALDELTRLALEELGTRLQEPIILDPQIEPAAIMGDEAQVSSVVNSLLVNAIEDLGDNGGTILVRTGHEYLDDDKLISPYSTEGLKPGEYAYLKIRDNGRGFDQETLNRLFDPFFNKEHGGNGLGLAAVLGTVRSHKGLIKVFSGPGRGALFEVFFPYDENAEEQLDTDAEVETQPRCVLVVDDELDMRELVETILEDSGFEVLLAADGFEGIRCFEENRERVSAVLLDMTMPGMSGLQVLEKLHELAPELPVIIMSGYSEVEVKSQYTDLGAVDFLEKPFRPDDLDLHVTRVVGGPDGGSKSQ